MAAQTWDSGNWDDARHWDRSERPPRRCLLGRRNFVGYPQTTFSEGNWPLPLTNLQDINPQVVAESADGEPTSTTLVVDLGVQRTVGAFSFANLRTTTNGIMRLVAGLDAAFLDTTFDTGKVTTWPQDVIPPDYNNWGEFTVTGVYSSEDYVSLGMPRVFVPWEPIKCRYIGVAIRDTQVVQIGHMGAWETWEPPHNIAYGWQHTMVDLSEVVRTPGGSAYVTDRPMMRRINFGFPVMPETEFLARGMSVGLIKGKSEPTIIIPKPDDTANLEKLSVYGTFSADPQFTNPFFGHWALTFAIDQLA